MPEYKCVFVKVDKKTIHSDIYADAETKLIQADTARAAAATYKLEANKWRDSLVGPIVRTCDENGNERFFPDTVSVGDKKLSTQKEIEYRETIAQLSKKKQTEAKQAEAKEAAQSSLSSTDVLLKELIKEQKQMIKEQKQTNEWLKKVRWSLLGINVIMVLWYVFGWVIYPI